MERSFGSFKRVVSLPEDVDQDGITAKYAKGVLTVKLPRKSPTKKESGTIPIGGGRDSESHKQITG